MLGKDISIIRVGYLVISLATSTLPTSTLCQVLPIPAQGIQSDLLSVSLLFVSINISFVFYYSHLKSVVLVFKGCWITGVPMCKFAIHLAEICFCYVFLTLGSFLYSY